MTRREAKRIARAQRHNMGTPRISAAAETMCVAADRHYGDSKSPEYSTGVIHMVNSTKAQTWLNERIAK